MRDNVKGGALICQNKVQKTIRSFFKFTNYKMMLRQRNGDYWY